MRILTWNLDAPVQTSKKATRINAAIAQIDADVICLTEAFPHNIPSTQNVVVSGKQSLPTSRWKNAEDRGAAKVILWSRWGWQAVDVLGSPNLPAGRFIYAQTTPPNGDRIHVIGVGIPWAAYRDNECQQNWAGFLRYVSILRDDILPKLPQDRTIILGDTNMRFNAKSMHGSSKKGQIALAETLQDYHICTAGLVDPNSGKNMVDHIILSADFNLQRVAILKQTILKDAPHAPVIADILIE